MMKKNILGFVILFLTINFGLAQEKKITFTDQFVYQGISDGKPNPDGKFVTFNNRKNEALIFQQNLYAQMLYFQDNLGISAVNFDFDNSLKVNFNTYYINYANLDVNPFSYQLKVEKLNTEETILGKKCQNYLLDYFYKDPKDEQNLSSNKMKICIYEKSSTNNTNLLTNGLGIFGIYYPTKDKHNLEGLLMKIGQEESYDHTFFILKSQGKASKTVFIDHKKQREALFVKMDSLTNEYEEMNKSYEAEADSAYAVDAAADLDYIPEYTSTYKKEIVGMNKLAINNLPTKNHEKALPKYCFRIKEELPQFGNKEVGKHLQNYAGQLCDMYLSAADGSNVDKKGTTDEIRREGLWLLKNREKLDIKDQNLLDKYLDNLD